MPTRHRTIFRSTSFLLWSHTDTNEVFGQGSTAVPPRPDSLHYSRSSINKHVSVIVTAEPRLNFQGAAAGIAAVVMWTRQA